MFQPRSLYQRTLLIGSLTAFSSITNLPLQAAVVQAQTIHPLSPQLLAKRPKNASNSSKSGGVRGECPVGIKSLRALIANNDPGQTAQDHPTFWFYTPFGKTTFTPPGDASEVTVSSVKFVLLDENRKPVLKQPIVLTLPVQAGVVHFTVPITEKPLEAGKDYQWFFSIVCDAQQPSTNPTVSGWLSRVQTSAKPGSQTKTAQPDNRAFWFEYVSQVADTRIQQPDAWRELLQQFDLQEFAQQPIAELKVEK